VKAYLDEAHRQVLSQIITPFENYQPASELFALESSLTHEIIYPWSGW